MIILLLGLGCRAHLAPAPLPVGETGVARARAAGAEGDHPACTSGFRWWQLSGLRPRGRSGRPPRPVPDLPRLHPCPREGGAISNPNKKGRLCRSEAKASRQSRDRLKRHPQEGQHSAASWRDPGPSASGERLNRATTCCAMGLKPKAETHCGSVHESPVRFTAHAVRSSRRTKESRASSWNWRRSAALCSTLRRRRPRRTTRRR